MNILPGRIHTAFNPILFRIETNDEKETIIFRVVDNPLKEPIFLNLIAHKGVMEFDASNFVRRFFDKDFESPDFNSVTYDVFRYDTFLLGRFTAIRSAAQIGEKQDLSAMNRRLLTGFKNLKVWEGYQRTVSGLKSDEITNFVIDENDCQIEFEVPTQTTCVLFWGDLKNPEPSVGEWTDFGCVLEEDITSAMAGQYINTGKKYATKLIFDGQIYSLSDFSLDVNFPPLTESELMKLSTSLYQARVAAFLNQIKTELEISDLPTSNEPEQTDAIMCPAPLKGTWTNFMCAKESDGESNTGYKYALSLSADGNTYNMTDHVFYTGYEHSETPDAVTLSQILQMNRFAFSDLAQQFVQYLQNNVLPLLVSSTTNMSYDWNDIECPLPQPEIECRMTWGGLTVPMGEWLSFYECEQIDDGAGNYVNTGWQRSPSMRYKSDFYNISEVPGFPIISYYDVQKISDSEFDARVAALINQIKTENNLFDLQITNNPKVQNETQCPLPSSGGQAAMIIYNGINGWNMVDLTTTEQLYEIRDPLSFGWYDPARSFLTWQDFSSGMTYSPGQMIQPAGDMTLNGLWM